MSAKLLIGGVDSCEIRGCRSSDWTQLYEWSLSDVFVGRRFGVGLDEQGFVAALKARVADHQLVLQSGELIAQAMCYGVDARDGYAMVGIDVRQDWRRKGLGSGLTSWYLDRVFGRFPIRKVYIHRLVIGGCVGHMPAGLAVEGTLPGAEIVYGHLYDLMIMAAWAPEGTAVYG